VEEEPVEVAGAVALDAAGAATLDTVGEVDTGATEDAEEAAVPIAAA
jgi:hypothetical protein